MNQASTVRGPKHSVKKGKTPVLTVDDARELLDAIDTRSPVGLRDRAISALMTFTVARVGAVLKMRVEDVFVQGRKTWVRLHEKGDKNHEMPCHRKLDAYLREYIEALPSLGEDARHNSRPESVALSHERRPVWHSHRPPDGPGRRLPHDPPPRGQCRLTHLFL